MALTVEQVEAIRAAVRGWRRGSGLAGPPPDGQLEQIIEVMLGTSARIGEVLAIRKCDVDVTGSAGDGAPLRDDRVAHGQAHPSTAPPQDAEVDPDRLRAVLRCRGPARTTGLIASEEPEHLIFFSRNHTPLTTNNVRRTAAQRCSMRPASPA